MWNRNTLEDFIPASYSAIVGANFVEVTNILQVLGLEANQGGLPSQLYNPEDKDYINLSQELNQDDETSCQEALAVFSKPEYGLIDSHNGNPFTLHHSQVMIVNEDEMKNVTPISGTIDLVSSKGPLFLEIKGRKLPARRDLTVTNKEKEVLEQILKRIYRLRCSYGQVKNIVGFAVTSGYAWCFAFHRHVYNHVFNESLRIWRIKHTEVFKIWGAVAAACESRHSDWVLTSDGPLVNNCLQQFGYHPSLCAVIMESASQRSSHRVYHISFPLPCKYCVANGSPALGIPHNDIAFSMKVHAAGKHNNYVNEASRIKQIRDYLKCSSPEYQREHPFYAYFGMPYLDAKFPLISTGITVDQHPIFENKFAEMRNSLESGLTVRLDEAAGAPAVLHSPNVWDFFSTNMAVAAPMDSSRPNDRGGVIIMDVGARTYFKDAEMQLIQLGVMKSLELTHDAGVCHCDIRDTNILKFGSEYQLIDYNLAVSVKGNVTHAATVTFGEGAQYDGRGSIFHNRSIGDTVEWTATHDCDMFMTLLLKKYVPRQPTQPAENLSFI